MMALATPDPALYLPPGTVLQPKIFLRNASNQNLVVGGSLRWRAATTSGTADLGTRELAPGSLATIDVFAMQRNGIVPMDASWATPVISYAGRYGDLVAIVASYDAAGKIGLQTPFNDLAASRWAGSRWFADTLRNSIITVGNASDGSTTANLTLHYNGGKTRYEVEQSLKPGEQIWLDVGELIQSQRPDKNGTVIPPDVEYGTYTIRDVDHLLGQTLYEGKLTIDKKFGHASYGCGFCCDPWAGQYLSPSQVDTSVGNSWQFTIIGFGQCGNENVDLTANGFNWGSGNTGVATVSSTGLGHAVGPGSTSMWSYINTPGTSHKCPYHVIQTIANPVYVRPAISGPNTVWWFNGQNPAGYATSITLTSSGGASSSWAITAGASDVTLSSTSGSSTTVSSSGAAFSSAPGDVKITATANGVTSSPFSVTTRKPASLISPSVSTRCDSQFGYETDMSYVVADQLGTGLPTSIDWNEKWTTNANPIYSGTNWPQNPVAPATALYVSSAGGPILIDGITGPGLNNQPANIPQPTCNAHTSVEIVNWGQAFSVGSQATGTGVQVRLDTLHKWIDHGVHTQP